MKQIIILAAWLIAISANAQNRNENPLATAALQKLIVAEANIKQLYLLIHSLWMMISIITLVQK